MIPERGPKIVFLAISRKLRKKPAAGGESFAENNSIFVKIIEFWGDTWTFGLATGMDIEIFGLAST